MLYIQKTVLCIYIKTLSLKTADGFFLLKMVILGQWQNQRLGLKISCGEDVHLFSDYLCKLYIKLECNATKLIALFFQVFNSLRMGLISHCFALFVVM